MWLRFVEEATRGPLTARQFQGRAEPALIAAVGLDLEKRRRVEQLLAERLRSPGLTASHELDLIDVAMDLGDLEYLKDLEISNRLLQVVGMKDRDVDQNRVAGQLVEYARRLTPVETAKVLTQGLSAVAQQVDPGKASQMCSPLIDNLVSNAEREKYEPAQTGLVGCATTLLQAVDPETATHYSRRLARSICSGALRLAANPPYAPVGPDPVLTNSSWVEVNRRAAAAATALGLAAHGPFAALAPLPAASDPLPCRLSTQDLVDLLKMPTCFGEDRQVVLKHLGNRCGRPFADHWEFVRFAQAHHLDLDFTTPPKRPGRP